MSPGVNRRVTRPIGVRVRCNEGASEILCVSRMMNSLAQHESIFELDSQLRFGSMP